MEMLDGEELVAAEDDGRLRAVVGTAGRQHATASLSRQVLELAAPMVRALGRGRRSVWAVLLTVAARSWNLAVRREGDGSDGWAEAVARSAVEMRIDPRVADAALRVLVERKELLFPSDRRLVAGVEVDADGRVFCRPHEVQP